VAALVALLPAVVPSSDLPPRAASFAELEAGLTSLYGAFGFAAKVYGRGGESVAAVVGNLGGSFPCSEVSLYRAQRDGAFELIAWRACVEEPLRSSDDGEAIVFTGKHPVLRVPWSGLQRRGKGPDGLAGCSAEAAIAVAKGHAATGASKVAPLKVETILGPIDWKALARHDRLYAEPEYATRRGRVGDARFFFVTLLPDLPPLPPDGSGGAYLEGGQRVWVDASTCEVLASM